MDLKIIKIDSAIKVPINFDAYKMFSSEKTEIINLQFKSNEELPLHDNPFDVIFYVLEGKGEFLTEDRQIEISADSCFEVKSGNRRGWKNPFDTMLKILVIKQL